MIKIDPFYEKINDNAYTFGVFSKKFPDFIQYALKALNEKIGCIENPNNFAIKVNQQDPGQLVVYSLLPDFELNEEYHNIIPENGSVYKLDLIKESQEDITISCNVKIPTYENKIILFKVKQTKFRILKKEKIKFPEDYFLKGYRILGEIVTQTVLNNVINIQDHTKNYSNFKQICLNKIQKSA